jgi:uncharacterized protein YutE (UPF0331/DUF86 family)
MADAVILGKTESIVRCIQRIEEDYLGFEEDFKSNFMRQDAVILNLQRACEQVIDLANHLIKIQDLTVPKNSRDSFKVLTEAGILPDALGQNLERMVGFRNVAVHEYQKINLDIVTSIVQNHLSDLRKFIGIAATRI